MDEAAKNVDYDITHTEIALQSPDPETDLQEGPLAVVVLKDGLITDRAVPST